MVDGAGGSLRSELLVMIDETRRWTSAAVNCSAFSHDGREKLINFRFRPTLKKVIKSLLNIFLIFFSLFVK